MPKVSFAVSFIVVMVGAVLLLISQIPLTREYYDVVETRSFSPGEPLTFYWTFEANVDYRLEAKGVNWTSSPRYVYYLMVGNYTDLAGRPFGDTPWVWDWNQDVTCAYNVTFYHYNYSEGSRQIERGTIPSTSVEISQLKKNTYHLTYLIYVGLPLLIIGAIVITIAGKDVDSRMRTPDTSARWYVTAKLNNAHRGTTAVECMIESQKS